MSDEKVELKPCPFCKGTRIRLLMFGIETNYTCCSSCYAQGPVKRTKEEAAAAWNTRAGGEMGDKLNMCGKCLSKFTEEERKQLRMFLVLLNFFPKRTERMLDELRKSDDVWCSSEILWHDFPKEQP